MLHTQEVADDHSRRQRFPAAAKQAKASGGEVYFWDESGFRADTVHGKTWRNATRWGEITDLARCGVVALAGASGRHPRESGGPVAGSPLSRG
jgi:hypothetical protein